VTEIPRSPIVRSAKFASLPLGYAARLALGVGQRAVGQAAHTVSADLQQHTAERLFSVLGELKGGAMKLAQALSVFEAALPERLMPPYRATLTRLQDSAPSLPVATVHKVMRAELGPRWQRDFRDFDDAPAAAASIGQVHRAVWRDGRQVAVKVQYPGIREAMAADLDQLGRVAGLFRVLQPKFRLRPVIAELRSRLTEELDYEFEAQAQRGFAAAYTGDDEIAVPGVVAATGRVLVTDWFSGTPLSAIIAGGDQTERDRAGYLLATLHFSAPARAGLLHADPHPGNFRMLADGRLGVLDFGAVARLPGGLPADLGRLLRATLDRDAEAVHRLLRTTGFLEAGSGVSVGAALDYLVPAMAPLERDDFRFSRSWLRQEVARVTHPHRPGYRVSRRLQLPPAYLLIHRVTLGSIGMLCQLEAHADYRNVVDSWLPGFGCHGSSGQRSLRVA